MSTAVSRTNREFTVPGRGRGLLDVFSYRYLLRLLVRKGTLTRYHGSVLGWTWSYVKPAAQFFVFYFVFGIFLELNHNVPAYPVYLFSGIVLVNLFTESFNNGTRAIVDNAPLVKKIYLPRELFPVAAVIVAFVHFLPQVLVLVVVCLIVGWVPGLLQILAILLGAFLVILLATGLGLIFGAVNASYRDAQNVVELILLFATWTSPVLYFWTMVVDKIPHWLFVVYQVNPLTSAVELFHYGFWGPLAPTTAQPPHLAIFSALSIVVTLVVVAIGQLVFTRFEGRFAQDL